jgi:hypothetical protein
MAARTCSIKQSDTSALRRIFARHGTDVPEDVSDNHWTRHGIKKKLSYEKAMAFGPDMQIEHKEEIGQTFDMSSVTELLRQKKDIAESYFNGYIVPLSRARASGTNNQVIQEFARSLLSGVDLEPDEAHKLMRIANTTAFGPDDTSFMEQQVRYALVEELRDYLPEFMGKQQVVPARQLQPVPVFTPELVPETNMVVMQAMNQRLTANIAKGTAAGRSYGGCSGISKRMRTSADSGDSFDLLEEISPQDIFSGKAKAEDESEPDEDEYGPLTFSCQKGHTNTRKPGKFVKNCKKCGIDMSCGQNDDTTEAKVISLTTKRREKEAQQEFKLAA